MLWQALLIIHLLLKYQGNTTIDFYNKYYPKAHSLTQLSEQKLFKIPLECQDRHSPITSSYCYKYVINSNTLNRLKITQLNMWLYKSQRRLYVNHRIFLSRHGHSNYSCQERQYCLKCAYLCYVLKSSYYDLFRYKFGNTLIDDIQYFSILPFFPS